MAFSRLLLPLICMLIPRVRDIQGRPVDFVCNDRARRDMVNIRGLEDAMLFQQRAEVVGALRLLLGGVGALRSHTSLTECQKSVLSRLDHYLRNHLLIVNQLELQGCKHLREQQLEVGERSLKQSPGETTPRPSTGAPAECPSQPSQSFREVLQRYQALLRGKLDRLATALQSTTCLHW
ncbi:hypothetical protein CRUP_017770 [Coryphaenoides rupestris]|nr:hypothetical protein CRUP_017770 [Coryphaenoides rupestris]